MIGLPLTANGKALIMTGPFLSKSVRAFKMLTLIGLSKSWFYVIVFEVLSS